MQLSLYPAIPNEIAHAAEAIFAHDNFYILLGARLVHHLSPLAQEEFSVPGWDADLAIPVLPLITLFQSMEKLTDWQAVYALNMRLDWKYALHIPVNYPLVPAEVLCQYRKMNKIRQEHLVSMQVLLERLSEDELLKIYFPQPVNAENILETVCMNNRFKLILNAMQLALVELSFRYPEWLYQITLPDWYIRYQSVGAFLRMLFSSEKPETNMVAIGEDIHYLLESISEAHIYGMDCLPEIQNLFSIWLQQFSFSSDSSVQILPQCTNCYAGKFKFDSHGIEN